MRAGADSAAILVENVVPVFKTNSDLAVVNTAKTTKEMNMISNCRKMSHRPRESTPLSVTETESVVKEIRSVDKGEKEVPTEVTKDLNGQIKRHSMQFRTTQLLEGSPPREDAALALLFNQTNKTSFTAKHATKQVSHMKR